MTATSSDAESLREQIELGFDALADKGVDTSDLRARVAYLLDAQPASSAASKSPDLRAVFERILRLVTPGIPGYLTVSDHIAILAREGLTFLDTAQPDLRRTPEAEIDVDELLRILDDAAIQGVVGARLLYAKLAATPAMKPAEEEPWDHPYEAGTDDVCITCGRVGSYAHTKEFYSGRSVESHPAGEAK